jgi:hypothetical protein
MSASTPELSMSFLAAQVVTGLQNPPKGGHVPGASRPVVLFPGVFRHDPKNRDVETGQVASQLFFSANLRLNAWIDRVEPGVIVFNSAATSMGHEMCNLDPLGIPAKSLSRIT